ncbi:hypothetical protein TCAL_10668 [Tigriopus californicus]|uniref:Beta-hexosaminidase n=1 Tax=Tigriopus californicus TaxID=6832 RepID=A0A553NYL0_TIGCA|nr:hypothetical protein TCAL_10668 [Tigriopus californicus]
MSTSRFLSVSLLLLGTVSAEEKLSNFAPAPYRAGPWVLSTRGEIWPKPQIQQSSSSFFSINPDTFQFKLGPELIECEIVQTALPRFFERVFPKFSTNSRTPKQELTNAIDQEYLGGLDHVRVELVGTRANCETHPYFGMIESYNITIGGGDKNVITSESVWGLLKGLESFSQLVYSSSFPSQINETTIQDYPRFPHRGFMVDSSRHFLQMKMLKQTLDILEMNKINVFHWHLVDDQSFPYQSMKFPNLSLLGAYQPYTHTYSPTDVEEIIEFARLRGIRVIPEFDTPGHTQSWELGQPGVLTQCYTDDGHPDGSKGPMDPSNESLFDFLTDLFQELSAVFPDNYVHLGGDEVDTSCWESNPHITEFMAHLNITGEYRKLESYHVERVLGIVDHLAKKSTPIVWEEVFDNGDNISKDTLVHATKAGFRVLLSSPFYLNRIAYGTDWVDMYKACIWGEWVDSVNLVTRAWPRGCAFAERFWSDSSVKDEAKAAPRLQEQECRMLQRGYRVNPIVGPNFCPVDWDSIL